MNKTTSILALFLLGACSTASVIDESRACAELGQYERAFDILDSARERALASPGAVDPTLERAWREARLTALIERGREEMFQERTDEALVALAGVQALDPDNPEVEVLRARAIEKKAAAAVAKGQVLLAERMLEESLAAFLEADRILPGMKAAREGIDEVREQVARLTERAQAQFLAAVRKLPEFRYVEVRWHSANALDADPTRRDAEEIQKRARREIALETMNRGIEDRHNELFGAALIKFRAAKSLDKTLPGVDAAIADMEREIEAGKLADAAQMHMRRQDFAKAREVLEEAYAKSELLRSAITDLMVQNRQMEAERDYEAARDLEYQGLKQEALEAFVALSGSLGAELHDEKVRIEALQVDITNGKQEWDLAVAAEKEGRLEDALEHYTTSMRFYARLHDAKERIARLKKRLGKDEAGEAKPASAGPGGS